MFVDAKGNGESAMHFFIDFIDQYGYLVLLMSICLGIIALPLPIEAIMGYAGLLAYQGRLNWFLCILAAGIGGSLGMAIAYWIGSKMGMTFFLRYGRRIHIGPERIQQISEWFKRYGNKLLIISFFIPGVRHMTGYFAGITRLPVRTYAIYAGSGSFIWVSTIILLGKMLGPKWELYRDSIQKYSIVSSISVAVFILIIYLLKKYGYVIIYVMTKMIKSVHCLFNTRRRLQLFMAVTSVLTFIFLIIGMI